LKDGSVYRLLETIVGKLLVHMVFLEPATLSRGESAMTDEPPGDAEFKRWFAEQDPFRSIEVDHRLEEFQRLRELRLQEQKKTPPPVFGLFGMALIPYVLIGLGLVVAAFFLAWTIRTMP